MSHWVISVPLLESEANTRNVLHTRLKFQNLADVSSLKIPSLKIGTLDSLLSLSDDLVKISGEKYEKVRLPEVEKEGSPGSPRRTLLSFTPLFVHFQLTYYPYQRILCT